MELTRNLLAISTAVLLLGGAVGTAVAQSENAAEVQQICAEHDYGREGEFGHIIVTRDWEEKLFSPHIPNERSQGKGPCEAPGHNR